MTNIEKFPRVTVEDVMRDYESAAEEVEAMGTELISAAKKWEAMTVTVHNTIRDTAEAYREEGKRIFGRIEECALLTEEVRKTCKDVKRSVLEGNGEVQYPS
jgi:DNA polymerase III gamma/tau subunit